MRRFLVVMMILSFLAIGAHLMTAPYLSPPDVAAWGSAGDDGDEMGDGGDDSDGDDGGDDGGGDDGED